MEPRDGKEAWPPEAIRRLRVELGCTQEEFSKVLGVTNVALSRWETGKARPQGRNLGLLGFLDEFLREPGADPNRLKRLLLLGGVLAVSGIAPAALLASGLLTERFVRDRIGDLFPRGEEAEDAGGKTPGGGTG